MFIVFLSKKIPILIISENKDDEKEISYSSHSPAEGRLWKSYTPYIKYTKLDFEARGTLHPTHFLYILFYLYLCHIEQIFNKNNFDFDSFLDQVDTFYAVGSPLGFFLALRNIRIGIGNQLKSFDNAYVWK